MIAFILTACAHQAGLEETAQHSSPAPDAKNYSHYVEFRARGGVMPYGHTYAVFGRLGCDGKPITREHIGLLPAEPVGGTLTSFVASVPSTLAQTKMDRRYHVVTKLRHPLTAREFRRLKHRATTLRRARPRYHLFGQNCNWLAAKLARTVGLRADHSTNVWAYTFIDTLKAANPHRRKIRTSCSRTARSAAR